MTTTDPHQGRPAVNSNLAQAANNSPLTRRNTNAHAQMQLSQLPATHTSRHTILPHPHPPARARARHSSTTRLRQSTPNRTRTMASTHQPRHRSNLPTMQAANHTRPAMGLRTQRQTQRLQRARTHEMQPKSRSNQQQPYARTLEPLTHDNDANNKKKPHTPARTRRRNTSTLGEAPRGRWS